MCASRPRSSRSSCRSSGQHYLKIARDGRSTHVASFGGGFLLLPLFPSVPEKPDPNRLRRSDDLRPSTLSRFFDVRLVGIEGAASSVGSDLESVGDVRVDAGVDGTVDADGGVCGTATSFDVRLAVSWSEVFSLTDPVSLRQKSLRLCFASGSVDSLYDTGV